MTKGKLFRGGGRWFLALGGVLLLLGEALVGDPLERTIYHVVAGDPAGFETLSTLVRSFLIQTGIGASWSQEARSFYGKGMEFTGVAIMAIGCTLYRYGLRW